MNPNSIFFEIEGQPYINRPKYTIMDLWYQYPTANHGKGSVMAWGACHLNGVYPHCTH